MMAFMTLRKRQKPANRTTLLIIDYENQRNGEDDRADRFGSRDQRDQYRSGSPRSAVSNGVHRLVTRPSRREHEPEIARLNINTDVVDHPLSHSRSPLSPPQVQPGPVKIIIIASRRAYGIDIQTIALLTSKIGRAHV